ncbi:MYCBP-associated protein isoform X1 [Pleurodeles waltl]|uniref:MYCBP-associated protein isoform X1 n=1 Tax=Pleurodeles waltl TaxID=8319 RepID=UPI00370948C3
MASRPGKRDSRTRTPPEKKRSKGLEVFTPPVLEEPEPPSNGILSGEEIQALAIRVEDLEKLHAPRPPPDEQKPPVTSRVLVRKHRPEEKAKRTNLVVARPATSDAAPKGLDYAGLKVPHVDCTGQVPPHSILGSLQELKREAVARGNTQLAELIPDSPSPASLHQSSSKDEMKDRGKDESCWAPPKQHRALENWNYHMGLRKLQMRNLSKHLETPTNELLMNIDDYRRVQEERTLIDRCLPAIQDGKGYRAGSEFWNQPVHIGDELSGLTITLTQQQRGYPEPLIHVQKPKTIQLETGPGYPTKRSHVHSSWDKSIYLLQRRLELRPILEELSFTEPEIEGLEVIGKGRPYTSMSVSNHCLHEQKEEMPQNEKETLDPLKDYPDVIPEIVLGPSIQFCGQPARWIGSNCSHREEIGISARMTFEAVAGDKATSVMEVANDGTTAIWYEWRRLPYPVGLPEICTDRSVQRFYFNTNSGVILPGDTKAFSFLFRSPSAGIFSESWEFCTHPVLLGGASLQLSLFGISLYEDKTAELRRAVQSELEAKEAVVIAEELLLDLLSDVRSPERPRSPMDSYVTEEDLFKMKNPQLYYKDHIVREMHAVWKHQVDVPTVEEGEDSKSHPTEVVVDSKLLSTTEVPNLKSLPYTEVRDPKTATSTEIRDPERLLSIEVRDLKSPTVEQVRGLKGASATEFSDSQHSIKGKSSTVEEVRNTMNLAAGEVRNSISLPEKLEGPSSSWNLSLEDFKQAMLSIHDEEHREAVLSQLNKGIVELSFPLEETQPDLLYQTCLQLWRETIDGLVNHSILLRSILGLPEKEPPEELVQEEAVEPRRASKFGREEKKGGGLKEEKKITGSREKEEKKGATKPLGKDRSSEKEDRPVSRKSKGKEDKRGLRLSRDSKDLTSSTDSLEHLALEHKIQQPDPAAQAEYQEKLYTQVYGLLVSLVENLVYFSEGLKNETVLTEEEEVELYMLCGGTGFGNLHKQDRTGFLCKMGGEAC